MNPEFEKNYFLLQKRLKNGVILFKITILYLI